MRHRGRSALVAVLALLVGAAGCGGGSDNESLLGTGGSRSAASAAPAATTSPAPTTVPGVLDALAAAVTDGDRRAYAALLGGGPAFRADQLRLFDNLQRLPVSDLRLTTDADGVVRRTLRLGSYDAAPLEAPAGIRVGGRADGGEAGRLVVRPDPAHPASAPWDLTEVRVARSADALVVTDRAEADRADDVLAATAAGIEADGRAIEVPWPRTAVVYVFRDPAVLATYAQVPGGSFEHLGAITYPVRDGDDEVVGSRIGLLAPALGTDRAGLERVLRHELVHVALGTRDDDVPTWLAEGVAEYVADLPVPPAQRRIATVAVDRSQAGYVDLPRSESFNGPEQDLHYSVSRMVCDYLAATQGPGVLWRLLDAMAAAGVGRDGAGQGAVLRQVTGVDGLMLGERTAERILAQFG